MDMIAFDTRSLEQHKYLIGIKCNASNYYTLLPIQAKSQATDVVSKWIKSLRSDPLLQDVAMILSCTSERTWRERVVQTAPHGTLKYATP